MELWQRFTSRARRAVLLAHSEATRAHVALIGTEHLLLGLLRVGEGTSIAGVRLGEGAANQVLHGLGVDTEALRADLAREMKVGDAAEGDAEKEIRFTPEAQRVLQLAYSEAHRLCNLRIGTEHILLGLLALGKGVAYRLLRRHGVGLPEARQAVADAAAPRAAEAPRSGATIEPMLTALGIADAAELLSPFWDDTQAHPPGPEFLAEGPLREALDYAKLPDELGELVLEAAVQARGDAALRQLVWHCHRLYLDHRDYPQDRVMEWPAAIKPQTDCGPLAALPVPFGLLVGLTLVPRTLALHRERGVDDAITRATLGCFEWLVGLSEDQERLPREGRWSVSLRVPDWGRRHFAAELFRLGRLNFVVGDFWGQIHAFRHRATGEVIALSDAGVRYNAQGYRDAEPAADAWEATLAWSETHVTGFPISPWGHAVFQPVALPLDLWEHVLGRRHEDSPRDRLIEVHIPGGRGMTIELVNSAMAQALEFFPRHVPESPFMGFSCGSWILNPEFERMLGPGSNMVKFERELYLFPYPSHGRAGLREAFGTEEPDPATAPRVSRLQRALLEELAAGRPTRPGAMFLLTEEFARFGTQPYRSQWPPESLRATLGDADG